MLTWVDYRNYMSDRTHCDGKPYTLWFSMVKMQF